MSKYYLEEKPAFEVSGIGTELTSRYDDYVGLNNEKQAFEAKSEADGTVEKLKEAAKNKLFFTVNEAYNNKMMYYFGVETDQELADLTRKIEFPAGMYLVVKGEAASEADLRDQLTYAAFGEALNEETDYAYVGGPNTIVQTGVEGTNFKGEMWIPVVKN